MEGESTCQLACMLVVWTVLYTFWLSVFTRLNYQGVASLSICSFILFDSIFCFIWIKVFVQAVELVIYIITLPLTHQSIIATHTCIIILCFSFPFFVFPSLFPSLLWLSSWCSNVSQWRPARIPSTTLWHDLLLCRYHYSPSHHSRLVIPFILTV